MSRMNIKQDIHSIDGYQKLFSKLENPDVVFQNYEKNSPVSISDQSNNSGKLL